MSMWFWFVKPKWGKKALIWKIVLFSALVIVGSIFAFKSINLAQDIRSRNFAGMQDSLSWLSAWIAWFDKELWYAWFIVDKVIAAQWLHTLTSDEFYHLIETIEHPEIHNQLAKNLPEYTQLLREIPKFWEDFYSLLGYEEEQTYLIILQNTNEARPNWWFFWSFALIKLDKWTISHLEIIDSYLPWFDRPNTFITGPEWFLNFLPKREIYFIGANKVWFTYHDWAHIKTLYEKSYPWQKIRGVIFLTTDMFKDILEDFDQTIWEWQFANANIDKIRGNDTRGKKEFYLKWSQEYFLENQETLIRWLIKNLPDILDQGRINIYLVDISWPFHGYIRRNNLTTRFEENTAYLRESNISFNKIDNFVDKEVSCFTGDWTILLENTNTDIFSLLPLWSEEHTCKITYTLAVPQEHIDFMRQLEDQYDIEMWTREEHILAMRPNRDSRIIFHIPPEYTIKQLSWDSYETEIFQTPFSSAAMVKLLLEENNTSSTIFVTFERE